MDSDLNNFEKSPPFFFLSSLTLVLFLYQESLENHVNQSCHWQLIMLITEFIDLVHQDQTHKHAHMQDEHVYKLLINSKEKQEDIFSLYLIIKSAITIPTQNISRTSHYAPHLHPCKRRKFIWISQITFQMKDTLYKRVRCW